MMVKFGWAKYPMHQRLDRLDPKIQMTLIYGAQSWVDHFPTDNIRILRPNSVVDAYVRTILNLPIRMTLDIHKAFLQVLEGAGHHVYADKSREFNDLVRRVCSAVDDEKQDIVIDKNVGTNSSDSNENYLDVESEGDDASLEAR